MVELDLESGTRFFMFHSIATDKWWHTYFSWVATKHILICCRARAELIIFTEFQMFSVFSSRRDLPTGRASSTQLEITTAFRKLLRQHSSELRYPIHAIQLSGEIFLSSNTAEIYINKEINNHHGTSPFAKERMLEHSYVGLAVM